ncbi:MAG TPA: bifunctional phosphoribosyl-AMP cyclohydrolase/phosphoribosyl-ATP diphosphatase HisIE [Thermoanaerobaculia bacterium]|nr:bifunctional phosphoribosyl-AMP cyclohydrolase/phosphoribosyl-ATP diphosphatase HisIE [Thermoanaerobaculia bacterium]
MTQKAPASPDPASLVFDDRGLLPVVAQDVATGAVLMVAWADRAAVERTRETGWACFFSRSRGEPWMKGETSGNRLRVMEVLADCDRDTLLYRILPEGPACHRGTRTCFEPNPAALELGWLARVLAERRGADPEASYTARLLAAGPERIGRKLVEEAVEVLISAIAPDDRGAEAEAPAAGSPKDSLAWEAADLLYHLLVLLEERGVEPEVVARELARRHRSAPPDDEEAR